MRSLLLPLCIALTAPAAGCVKRDTAYQFRAPGLATARLPELSPTPVTQQPAGVQPVGPTRIATNRLRTSGTGGSIQTASTETTAVTTDLDAVVPGPAAISPPPTELPDRVELGEPLSLADTLRAMVGGRRNKAVTDVDLALTALEALGTVLDDQLATVTTGAELVALAEARGAMGDGETPLLGDLIVLLDSSDDDPVIAVVVGIDPRGTIEIIHLTRLVVRRSFLTLGTPDENRDGDGVVLNTLIRHKEGNVPRGTKFLAGQLFLGHIRLDQLVE